MPGAAPLDLGGAQLPAAAHEHFGPAGLCQGLHPGSQRQGPRPARPAAGPSGNPQEGLAPQAPHSSPGRRRRAVPCRPGLG